MDNTTNLSLPYILPSQAQKHVTFNEAVARLDAIVQMGVVSRAQAAPPSTPSEGERHIIPDNGSWGAPAGWIAAFQDSAWSYMEPREGWLAWIGDEQQIVVRTGDQWQPAFVPNPVSMVGVNTAADGTNRLALKSDAALFSHDDVTPGSGDMRVKVNKAGQSNTASFLFQTGWSGRAEIGLTGGDDLVFKVSPDGAAWHEGLKVDRTTGHAGLGMDPGNYRLAVNGGMRASELDTYAQIGGISWYGDVDEAKWTTKLGGYYLSFLNDSAATPNLEGATIAHAGRTWRSKIRMHPVGNLELAGTLQAAGIGTTANAANVHVDGDGWLVRSTSTLACKRDVEPVDPAYSRAFLQLATPIWYRSLAPGDDPDWGWWGYGAEDIARIDPRLVAWSYDPDDYEIVPAEPAGEDAIHDENGAARHDRRPRPGAAKKPTGVAYERIVVHLHVMLREAFAEIGALTTRVEALEAIADGSGART